MEQYTPMMQAYLKTKEEYKDAILFYRLGDFYEMFFDDAITVSNELELVLTGKSCGTSEKAPMCGVPFHAADSYIARLTDRGYKVAICEQIEDPKQAKGLVKRDVVRIITPGTNLNTETDGSVFIICIIGFDGEFGVSLADVTTGEFIIRANYNKDRVKELIQKFRPREILLNNSATIHKEEFSNLCLQDTAIFTLGKNIDDYNESLLVLRNHFKVIDVVDECYSLGVISAANLLSYLLDTQKNDLSHLNTIKFLADDGFLKIDAFTYRNLELIEPLRRDDNKGSLFYCMDKTNTSMGRRLLKSYIRYPLVDIKQIEKRLDAVSEFNTDLITAQELRDILKGIYDLERLISRVSYKSANPRDLLSLRDSLKDLPAVKYLLSGFNAKALIEISNELDELSDIYKLIDNAISDDAPVTLHDADIIKQGYSKDCDMLKEAAHNGRSLLSNLENKERERTGINKLKIKYNRVFGYYIEVTNSQLSMVPDDYIRRQTLANCERFFTEELKALEDNILGAKEKLDRLEFELFSEILNYIFDAIPRIQKTANLIARLDVFLSLSQIAVKNRYVRPALNSNGSIDIVGGRHPVVEMMQKDVMFIENDTHLNMDDDLIYLITGPNMAGKSTYMRQCALIVLMAQIGSFVPAKSADIGVCDRIFTRVGASDDLSSGQSTFMVEMNEMANILKNATKDSLIILDEIGRGTSTYDGMSIAWAVIEYIADRNKLGAKTLFATHYHELTTLPDEIYGIQNYSCAVKEDGDSIIFLRKIQKAPADKSYGIQVASLAGVPDVITNRAKEILNSISNDAKTDTAKTVSMPESVQLSFFDFDNTDKKIINELKEFDVNNATPVSALNFLNDLKGKYQL